MFNTEIVKYFVSLKYILDVLMSIHTTIESILINEKNFHIALREGFANVKDWDDHR